jgi:hypothetical protein
MKTALEINNSILCLTNEIKKTYPELIKYIAEIPVKDVFTTSYQVNTKNLLDYYNTLEIIFYEYALKHNKNSGSVNDVSY